MASRVWFACDTGFLSDHRVAQLGADFGAGGPLAVICLLAAAKLQDESGRVQMRYKALSRAAFLSGPKRARDVVAAATELKMLELIAIDAVGFEAQFSRWDRWQVKDPGSALRKARSRARGENVTPDVTAMSRKSPVSPVPGTVDREQKTGTTTPPTPQGDLGGVREVFTYWQEKLDKKAAKLSPERRRAIQNRLQDFSVADLKRAVDGCASSPFHRGENDHGRKHDDLTLICRNGSKVEQFMELADGKGATVVPLAPHCRDCQKRITPAQVLNGAGRCEQCYPAWERRVTGGDDAA